MSARVLVAYATKYGSTAEVAEAIGKRLRDGGLDAEVKPARQVRSLDGYGAVVFGAPLYIGGILKDGATFLEQNRGSLEHMPVAVFMLGPLKPEELDEARGQIDPALAKIPWLKPVATELFVGKYDPSKLRFADKLVAILPASPLQGVPAQDNRDWAAIEAWAEGLPDALAARV